jgi:hypothetical protein
MSTYQRTHAFRHAGLAVVEAYTVKAGLIRGTTTAMLTEIARRYVKSADPHKVNGVRGEQFDWSFDYEDVPVIVAEAEKILART